VRSKTAPEIAGLAVLLLTTVVRAAAQDAPGIEICTRESQPDRRVSCLQSNVENSLASAPRGGGLGPGSFAKST
jgi:hypothetical protein